MLVCHSLYVLLNMPVKCIHCVFTLMAYSTLRGPVMPKACNLTALLAFMSTE